MGQRSAEYWNPTRLSYSDSLVRYVTKLRDSIPPTPGDVEKPPRETNWAERHGRVLTSDKFRLSKREAFDKFWAKARRTAHNSQLGLTRIRAAGLLATREKVYNVVIAQCFHRNVNVKFSDGELRFPGGVWIGNLIDLADMCDLHPETVSLALDELHEAGVIHRSKTWNGTIVQVVGFYVNRRENAYVSIRGDRRTVRASLAVAPAEPPAPTPNPPLSAELKRQIDQVKRFGKVVDPSPDDLPDWA